MKSNISRYGYPILATVLLAGGCSDGTGSDQLPGTTFGRMQTAIFNTNCVACHRPGHPASMQSGLVLQSGASYGALVGMEPQNQPARAGGLLRVKAGDPDGSFLLHKLRWNIAGEYGQPMPLGGSPLSEGQVEFVRRWILAGAPLEGDVVDPSLLEDRTPQPVSDFVAPPRPERGYQLHLEAFPVPANREREIFVFKRIGNPEELWVNRFEIVMRPNTHHFILYGMSPNTPASALPQHDVIRDVWRADGTRNPLPTMLYRQFLGGRNYRFPAGVALRIPANASLDLNSHYVNGTSSAIQGEVYANLHTIPRSEVTHAAMPLFLNNLNINLPPRQRTTVARTFTMTEEVRLIFMTSHMHAKGERFVIRVVGGPRNGEVIYESLAWDAPEVATYENPIELRPGEGLRSEVTYYNPTDATVTFGLSSEDEMSIMVGYYYCPSGCSSTFSASLSGSFEVLEDAHEH